MTDPFDTAGLRAAVIAAWASSPTRLREDAAAEADLVGGGYRDRVLTELAQNAADAAARARVPGALSIRLSGGRLHVANIGAPLDVAGLQALASLRASSKSEASDTGRYGVGFTATVAVGDRIEFRSTTGSVVFDAHATGAALKAAGIAADAVERPPILRLPFVLDAPPADGWDSEVVITVRGDEQSLLDGSENEVVDLLLELPALESITLQGKVIRRTAEGSALLVGDRRWYFWNTERARWIVPEVDGRLIPVARDVLRAPTRSDEALTLPALVITTHVDLAPDRRRVMPGADVAALARGYSVGVAARAAAERPSLVPSPGLAAGEVDAQLRQAVLADLLASAWVPTVGGADVRPSRAVVVGGADVALGRVLAEVIDSLVDPEFASAIPESLCRSMGMEYLGWADVASRVTGITREPGWWYRLYDALDPLLTGPVELGESAALPVPLTDGRTVTGPRTVVHADVELTGGLNADTEIGAVPWARVVHPRAMHPLLTRLGARAARPADLLADPALAAMLDPSGADLPEPEPEVVVAVLTLAALAVPPDGSPIPGLGALPLRDVDGDVRPADELLLPDAPVASVLVADHPFSVVAPEVVATHGVEVLRAVGVGWSLSVLVDEHPVGPDHDLADEELWWEHVEATRLSEEPTSMAAVRDLDLVDDAAWPQALSLLVANPVTAGTLADRDGYTAWWLRTRARVGGVLLGHLRAPGPGVFEELLPELDHPHAAWLGAVLASDRVDSPELARALLTRLADPEVTIGPAAALRAHTLLADAVLAGAVDVIELDPPELVRAVDGSVCTADDAMVLDHPWLAMVLDPAVLVAGLQNTGPQNTGGSGRARADVLADLLDLPVASERVQVEVITQGRPSTVGACVPLAVALAALGGSLGATPDRAIVVHDQLLVRVVIGGAEEAPRVYRVPFWVANELMHVQSSWAQEVTE